MFLAQSLASASPLAMRRASHIATVVVLTSLALAAAAAPAAAQDPAVITPAELQRARGTLAWRRAVWGVSREGFERAVTELELCRDDESGRRDVTVLYLLGISYMRLERVAQADPALRDARSLAPDFPGLRLADAMRLTAVAAAPSEESQKLAEEAAKRYDDFLAGLARYPKDAAFAAELGFLGLVLRGTLNSRLYGRRDQAVADLGRARALAKEHGEAPSAELITLLANVHQSLDQLDDAKQLVREAMARDPAEPAHYYNYGVILAGTHDDAGARPWFEAALARRRDFAEAHVKIAYIASKSDDLGGMRAHLDAAAAIYEARAGRGAALDPRNQAEIDAGLGAYWKMVGLQRSDAGDAKGAREAFTAAEAHLRDALAKQPGCVTAISTLIQILSWIGAPERDQSEWKKRLLDTQQMKNRETDPYRSTFC